MSVVSVDRLENAVERPEPVGLPLVLDVDGALLRTDLLHETAIAYVKSTPLGIFMLVWWLLQGKAVLKRQLAERVQLDFDNLPVNAELEAYARAAHQQGRLVCLATAADQLLASRLAQRFDFISFVLASDGQNNLKGSAKAKALVERFPDGFAYAADSRSDLQVWVQASSIILVSTSASTTRQAKALGKPIEAVFPRAPLGLRGWAKALRLHQWAKNSLVFVPLVLAGQLTNPSAWLNAALAFLALGVLASATYLVNDVWDIEDDRRHWTKRKRPLASGRMTVKQAALVMPLAFVVSMVLGSLVGPQTVAVLLAYLVLTLCYSFGFKRKPVLDAFTLAVLFTLRLVLGIVAVGVIASPWLLVFSMFLFTSLSFAKRQTEVLRLVDKQQDTGDKISGRGYFVVDAPFILAMGVSCGMASILIMVLYLTQDAMLVSFYANPDWLWAIPAVLFLWLSRIWMLCQRSELLDDPVVFAMRDPKSLVLCAFLGAAFTMAWLGVPY